MSEKTNYERLEDEIHGQEKPKPEISPAAKMATDRKDNEVRTGIPTSSSQPTIQDVPISPLAAQSPLEKLPEVVPAWPPSNIKKNFEDQNIFVKGAETTKAQYPDYPADYPLTTTPPANTGGTKK